MFLKNLRSSISIQYHRCVFELWL